MNSHEKQEFNNPPLSILQRLARLDRLMLFLEEKYFLSLSSSSATHFSSAATAAVKLEDQCKSLSSALEEVHHKGSLMEQVAQLENRVIQLSLDMDMGEKLGHDAGSAEARHQKEDPNMITRDGMVGEDCSLNARSCICRAGRRRRRMRCNDK